jgi:colicin import membrane protein
MSRLQKKCLIATAGFHLLLVVTLVFGSAFFVSHSKPDETQVLNVIPANLIDAAFSSGVKSAQAPAPTPTPPQPQVQPQPTPPQPKPVVTPPTPAPTPPAPTLMEKVKELFTPEPKKLSPDDLKPVEPAKTTPKKIQVDLKPVVRKTPTTDTSEADKRAAAKEANRRKTAFQNAARSIKEKASTDTIVDTMPGTGSVSYANYASVVKSIYDRAWTPPSDMASDDVTTKVSVTISRDGTVISSRIIDRSGDSRVDASVQRVLDRVDFVAPFPDGATEKERTFIINFNPQAKRMTG